MPSARIHTDEYLSAPRKQDWLVLAFAGSSYVGHSGCFDDGKCEGMRDCKMASLVISSSTVIGACCSGSLPSLHALPE